MASEGPPRTGVAGAGHARRLHPWSIAFSLGHAVRVLLLPALVALVSRNETVWAIVGGAVAGPTIGVAFARYLTLRWTLGPDELHVRKGILFRSRRHIPYARIQDVEVLQGVLHRCLGVAEVRLQTASGAEPEAVLRVLGLPDVEALRAAVRPRATAGADDARAPAPPEPPAVEVLVARIPLEWLVGLGLVLHRGLAVVAGAFALLWEADLVEPIVERLPLGGWLGDLSASAGGAFLAGVLLLTGGVIVFALLSVLWSIVRFGGYRLERAAGLLHVRSGLLTRVQATVPHLRIQSLTIEETWMHRLLGAATISVRTAGGTAEAEDPVGQLRRRFVPILPAARVPQLVAALLPGVDIERPAWRPLGVGAPRRARRRALLLLLGPAGLALGGALAAVGGSALPVGLAILAPLAVGVAVCATAAAQRTRWALLPWGFAFRRGVLNRRTTLLPADRIQTVRTVESPFDRRCRHATLALDAAGGPPHTCEVQARYLDAGTARTLHAALAAAAARTEYRTPD